tara:strand:- start:1732 stop:2019 length:288 start_codon:yes stop_codon:yes gene_type:complete
MGWQANTPSILTFHNIPTGVVGTAAVGTATSAAAGSTTIVTGVSATGAIGINVVAPILTIGIPVTGVSATGSVGEEILWQEIVPSQTPNWIDIAA